MEPFTPVTTAEQLEAFGIPAPMNRDKVLDVLEDVHREWIAATTLVFVATSSADGRCDVSPKGDPAGFVRVLGPTRLAIPERPGNLRMDGFHNILENPHVGLVCLIPGRGDTLRINGRARLITELPDFDDMVIKGHRPSLALLVDVEEVFFHCPKAFRRSRTWGARGLATDGGASVRRHCPCSVAERATEGRGTSPLRGQCLQRGAVRQPGLILRLSTAR